MANTDMRIVVLRADGGISVIEPATNAVPLADIVDRTMPELPAGSSIVAALTRDELDIMLTPAVPSVSWENIDGVPTQVLNRLQLRHYRNAWQWGPTGIFVPAASKTAQDEANLRKVRNELLEDTDHEVLGDRPANPALNAYRQALRDVTQQGVPARDVVWPTLPPGLSRRK